MRQRVMKSSHRVRFQQEYQFAPLVRASSASTHPLLRLQRAVGNQAVGQILRSAGAHSPLSFSQPGDVYEKQADRIADQVTGNSSGRASPPKSLDQKSRAAAPAGVLRDLGEREPLPDSVRAYFEPQFGREFSQVRVHTGSRAAESARAVNALAYTLGPDVVFGRDQYAPHTPTGQRLLAHELAHVVQQAGSAHIMQRKAPSKPTAGAIPKINVVFVEASDRYRVLIDSIPVAEIAVTSKHASLRIDVSIEGGAAAVVVHHFGEASLAPVADLGASLGLSVRLREVDLRAGEPERGGQKEPPFSRSRMAGEVNVIIAPPTALRWADEPVGELGISKPLPPGSISEFEQDLRSERDAVTGVVLDPDDPREIIGYRVFATAGVTRLVDREGHEAFLTEVGLETPLVDPLDLIPTPGSIGKFGAGVGARLAIKVGTKKAAAKGMKVPLSVIARMRGVSRALLGRAARKGLEESPGLVRKITKAGLDHSFDRHAAEWFGRAVSRDTHYAAWRALVERAAASAKTFAWSTGPFKTIAHIARIEGKYFVVQFFEETGELTTAFVPRSDALREMLKLVKGGM